MTATVQPGDSQQAASASQQRARRLSPELSEFLHMLDSLEDHFEQRQEDSH